MTKVKPKGPFFRNSAERQHGTREDQDNIAKIIEGQQEKYEKGMGKVFIAN